MPDHADAALLARFTEELPVGLWVARVPSGELVYANRAFAEILGMGARDDVAVGDYAGPYGIHQRDGSPYPEDQMPFVRAVRERRTVLVDDIVIHRHDGGRVNIRAQARPIFDAAGEITHIVIAFIDFTREVEAEARRQESEARLAQAHKMESIGQLAGGIAHDFNNLLASVQVIASSLRRGESDPRRIEDLRRIDEVVQRAAQLTHGLLGFAGRGKHLAVPLSIDDVARGVGELVQRTFDRAITVGLDLGADQDVVGDRSQLEQLIMNLAVNARDAMTPGGGELIVRTRDEGARVVLEVADSGPGIPAEARARIFEPFFSTKTDPAGDGALRGLGLATVYGVVTAHGGEISVHDRAPRGTTMRVVLPGIPPRQRPARPPAGEPVARPGSETVLIVEDEPDVRLASARSLTDLGYRVLQAADGVEAVQIFRARHDEIDAVVLDMMMPRLDGRATYLAMREIRADVRVLLTTGVAVNEQAQKVVDLGVHHFLAKPYDVARLSEALGRVMEG